MAPTSTLAVCARRLRSPLALTPALASASREKQNRLARLDQDEEVKRDGRSAVLRRAADQYLRQRKTREVSAAYRRAYAGRATLGAEFDGWAGEGAWPAE